MEQIITGLLMLAVVIIMALVGMAVLVQPLATEAKFVLMGAGAVITVIAIAWQLIRLHFQRLKQLRGAVVVAASQSAAQITYAPAATGQDEVTELHAAMDSLMRDRLSTRQQINRRLEGVLSAVAEAVVVVTPSGLISLMNAGAKSLLASDRAAVGNSIYASVHTSSWEKAVDDTADKGGACSVAIQTLDERRLTGRMRELADKSGVTMVFDADVRAAATPIEHALDLHDQPPRPTEIHPDLDLDDLPGLVLDCETTGLLVQEDVLISVGAVRTHGARIFRSAVIDALMNPGRPIPKKSTQIHGITNEMVVDAKPFDNFWPDLAQLLAGTVIIGYNISFDIAFLRRAAAQTDVPWPEPLFLDLVLLYAAMEPHDTDLSLDKVAAEFGVEIEGRHTALGDALATAEVYSRMLPRLRERSVTTFGQAYDLQTQPKHLLAMQQKSGWHDGINTLERK